MTVTRRIAWDSSPITGLTFGTPYKYNAAYPTKFIRGDTFYNTWADNDEIYCTVNDTYNWNSSGATSNAQVSTLSGYTTSLTGSTVNAMSELGSFFQTGSDTYTYKHNGIISIAGEQYIHTCRQASIEVSGGYPHFSSQLLKSTDRWANWTPHPPSTANPYASPMWTSPKFGGATFIQYGKDYTQWNTVHGSDEYVYALSNDSSFNRSNNLYLGRCRIDEIGLLDVSKWSYYANGVWVADIDDAVPVLTRAGKLGMISVQYLPAFKRYVLFTWHYPSSVAGGAIDSKLSRWETFEAPTPWGPWNLVQTDDWGAGQAFYIPAIITKSLEVDGGANVMIATCGDFVDPGAQDEATGSYTLTLIETTINNAV